MSTIPEFNETIPSEGDPLQLNFNAPYIGLEYHYTYLVFCGFVVWLIIPGIGLLYGDLARRKSALTLLFQSLLVAAVTTFQWMFWGYTLAYSRTAGPFIGDMANFGMKNFMAAPSIGSAVCLYQFLFCACTVQIVVGGAFERGRIVPSIVFGFFWATIVYCSIACWTWNPNGWLFKLLSLDFAGGGPIHIAHGRPHNTTLVFLGTILIWFGWFGFNGGSALNASIRAMVAAFSTNAAASTGVIGWVLVDYFKHGRKSSVVGACEGAIAGLFGITPAAGYVEPWLAAVIGFVTAVVCSLLQNLNEWIRIDEGMDVFKLHGIGGMVGSFSTGLFATSKTSALDGATIASGALDGVGIQVGRQFAEITAISSYSFLVSCALLYILKFIPGMHLRVTEEAEFNGLDMNQFFEEQIGDWGIFEELNKRRMELAISAPGTPPC